MGKLFHQTGRKDENPRDLDKAIEYLERSLKMKREVGDKKGIANTLGNIAEIYGERGEYEKALAYMREGLDYAEKTNFKQWMVEGYFDMSEMYKQSGNYQNAYEYYVKYTAVKDTISGIEVKKAMAEMQGKYNTDRQNKEIELLSKDNELNHTKLSRQKFIIGAVVVGLVVVMVFAFFIYRGYKDKQRINNIIEEKNKNITDSIKYAKRIQTAILPSQEIMRKRLTDFFVLYRPKDIVSGDFYFFAHAGNKTIIAAADCTGHGVPGAFMSMIGNSLLNQIIKENGITRPSEVLNHLNAGVREALKQDEAESDTRDGMDIALCTIDHTAGKIEFAGANRNLFIVKAGSSQSEAEEIKADKVAIGGLQSATQHAFTNHEIGIGKGDTVYLSTDGYADQFGGKDGKKFRTKRFRELLQSVSALNTTEQEKKLDETLVAWMGKAEQLDDILVLGVKF